MRPARIPIGLLLARTAKAVSRAFDDTLQAAGGSLPTWLVLMSLMREDAMSHGALAERVGIRGPTLTHHLDALEAAGLIARARDTANRRVQKVRLTEAGRTMFHRLRRAAEAHDAMLRTDLSEADEEALRALLLRLANTVEEDQETRKGDRP